MQPSQHHLHLRHLSHIHTHRLSRLGRHKSHLSKNFIINLPIMGAGNSAPVRKAGQVEADNHQDLLELRFDHLAVGTTAIAIVIAALALYYILRKRRSRNKARRARDAMLQPVGDPWRAASYPWQPPTTHSCQLEMLSLLHSLQRQREVIQYPYPRLQEMGRLPTDPERFVELPSSHGGPPGQPPARPPLPSPSGPGRNQQKE